MEDSSDRAIALYIQGDSEEIGAKGVTEKKSIEAHHPVRERDYASFYYYNHTKFYTQYTSPLDRPRPKPPSLLLTKVNNSS